MAFDRETFISDLIDSYNMEPEQARAVADRHFPRGGTLDRGTQAFQRGNSAIDQYNTALMQSEGAFNSLNNAASSGLQSVSSLTDAFGQLGGNIPLVGGAFEALGGALSGTIGTVDLLFSTLTEFASDTLGVIDDITLFHRTFDKANFNLVKSFGGTFEEAQRLTDRFVNNMASYATIEYGFLSSEELQQSLQYFKNLNVSVEQATSTVTIGTRQMDLYAAAVLQAGAMGMDTTQYLRNLEKSMAQQGLTAQQAVEQMAAFSDIASKTGLNIDTVTSTLNNAASNFTKLGMSADFGRPILEGLANTMNDLGLGIENATGLTGELSQALGRLTTDYATAFVTQQRSGIDFGGGGGLLGASIGLQAQMLEAEQTGDQAGMASMLTGAMADTLRSFTGGDIITASQASNDPSLQMAFYSQQQLLGSQYGISDPQSQTRILDYLDRLETARASGDTDAAAMLERQIEEEIEGRDATLGELDKLNVQVNAMLMQSRLQTRSLTVMAAGLGGGLRGGLTGLYQDGLTELTRGLNALDEEADRFITGAGGGATLEQAETALRDPSRMTDLVAGLLTGQNPVAGVTPQSERESSIGRNLNVQIDPIVIILRNPDGTEVGRHTIERSELEQTPG